MPMKCTWKWLGKEIFRNEADLSATQCFCASSTASTPECACVLEQSSHVGITKQQEEIKIFKGARILHRSAMSHHQCSCSYLDLFLYKKKN